MKQVKMFHRAFALNRGNNRLHLGKPAAIKSPFNGVLRNSL